MIDVLELRNDVYIVYADVDADVRIASPPEVGCLWRVGDVELLFQVFRVVQILGQNISGELNFQPWKRTASRFICEIALHTGIPYTIMWYVLIQKLPYMFMYS